jgi:hypothetical protein
LREVEPPILIGPVLADVRSVVATMRERVDGDTIATSADTA